MFSTAWQSCLANLSRAPGCADRYGAKSRIGISASSRSIAESAKLMLALLVAER
jgi:hypothetical protein